MKKTFSHLMIISLLLILWTCGNSTQNDQSLSDLIQKLPGTWYNANSGKFEEWHQQDGNLSGKSYQLNEMDTIIHEFLKIERNNGSYIYVATVIGQNDNQPIAFKLSEKTENKLVFENPDHDFPQKIIYHFINDSTMEVFVNEIAEDLEKGFILKFNKINNL
ncbi:MAG: hypothetical protein KQI35_17025 [Bacteroidetes bacterium]|nr:hypothetical protein [Bacteroidota bacterium]